MARRTLNSLQKWRPRLDPGWEVVLLRLHSSIPPGAAVRSMALCCAPGKRQLLCWSLQFLPRTLVGETGQGRAKGNRKSSHVILRHRDAESTRSKRQVVLLEAAICKYSPTTQKWTPEFLTRKQRATGAFILTNAQGRQRMAGSKEAPSSEQGAQHFTP